MGIGKVFGSMSPLGGAITGKGVFGRGMAAIEDATGMGGIFPKMAQAARDKDRRQAAELIAAQKEADMRAKIRTMSGKKKGGSIKKMAKGGSISSASKRADGCATKGKTKGRMV